MIDVDIDEVIRAMLEKTEDITYYLHKDTGEIVTVDESIAEEVEAEYDEADTALEEWSTDLEDESAYKDQIYSDRDDLDEKELIKRIRFTKQEDYEPVPVLTIIEFKKIVFRFLKTLTEISPEILKEVESRTGFLNDEAEIELMINKEIIEKEKWLAFYHKNLRDIVTNWLTGLGFSLN